MTTVIDGNAVASDLRDRLTGRIDDLATEGVTPTLATVLMSDDPASETYVSMKQSDCEEVGIATRDVEIDPDAPAERLFDTLDDLNSDPEVDGVLVQMPTPDQVADSEVIRRLDPMKDVDGFHPENVGLLVRGDPRYKPCTPHGVQHLLDHAGVETEGADVVIVGRSNIVGKPLANMLLQKTAGGNATVTVCHSRTDDLAAHTGRADIVVAAAGVPELVDGSMLAEDSVVIDVGVNRVETEDGSTLVGDVAFDSASELASAITPVPGGVGPMTRAMLLYNTVKAAHLRRDLAFDGL
ncbi:tetrahydrofolate dehydrogenase/cyclohydrolase catalytic domain-containing protein [Halococcoides cellulosivorans]|uniref:Bifunctional protein FolD n=1 Tax=Halococcoides cellulosivorans TaxID=1679096 RepID=A0A2R4WZV6_9EURY|nr:tetrahydrofolate dehydrogenase/cyclohydrolase catalytic domain-containing protein [Halococcoides cellulosivorans]AWB27070.1 bifunctional 5,10-methylene-tetrahydrofolate dehydrogenase/5,10-methylene-tetrahydrofolate cyclohydrolase [Halococcoides cellulosivorans]